MEKADQAVQFTSIDRSLLWYESHPWIRAVVQAVPYGGGSLDTLLAWRAVYLNKHRAEELLNNVSERLSNVENLSESFLRSEDFFELLRTCLDVVSRSANESKRKYVADFLAGTIRRGCTHDLSQQIAEDLRAVQDFHLEIVTLIPHHMKTVTTSTKLQIDIIDFSSLRTTSNFDNGLFNKAISDLGRLGFVAQTSIGSTREEGSIMVFRPTKYLGIFKDSLAATDG